jgi:hypothetical protein
MSQLTGDDALDQITGGDQINTDDGMSTIDLARASANAPKAPGTRAPVDEYTGPRKQPNLAPQVWSAAKYTPTPSLHESMITSLENFDGNDPALAQARNAFSLATESLKKISDARDPLARDTSKLPEAKLLLMATHAEKAQDRCAKAFDGALKSLTALAKALEDSLSAPLEQTTHSALCQEIRSYVRGLPKDERDAFVNDAVRRGDKDVMVSVLGAPSYLSGIADERNALWLREYRAKADPIAVMRLSVYRAAIERVNDKAPLMHDEFQRAMGGKWKDVQRLRGQTEASDKALRALAGE